MTATATLNTLTAGTWAIDPTHSEVGFSIRHIMISKVKGKFERFDATFVTGERELTLELRRRRKPALYLGDL